MRPKGMEDLAAFSAREIIRAAAEEKHLPGARKGREEGAKEMSREDRLPEERCRSVGLSELLSGRRSEEMTQSNTFSLQGSLVPLESQRG